MFSTSVLAGIGNTPLVRLQKLSPQDGANVYVKLESKNPSGSSKDRSALSMIEGAERDGRLKPGMRVVESSGGSTGTSLAMICAVKGYECTIVTSDAFADEKLKAIRAFGATLDVIHGKHGKATYPALYEKMGSRLEELAKLAGHCALFQNSNPHNTMAYRPMAEEILEQLGGKVDAFVMSCGSGGCFSGCVSVLKEASASTRGIAVEPQGYRHISGGLKGIHHIDGIGDGPPGVLFRRDLVDDVFAITDDNAYETARQLARHEGIFGGKSAGANVAAALKLASTMRSDEVVVTVICDSGYKYLSGDLFEK